MKNLKFISFGIEEIYFLIYCMNNKYYTLSYLSKQLYEILYVLYESDLGKLN